MNSRGVAEVAVDVLLVVLVAFLHHHHLLRSRRAHEFGNEAPLPYARPMKGPFRALGRERGRTVGRRQLREFRHVQA